MGIFISDIFICQTNRNILINGIFVGYEKTKKRISVKIRSGGKLIIFSYIYFDCHVSVLDSAKCQHKIVTYQYLNVLKCLLLVNFVTLDFYLFYFLF